MDALSCGDGRTRDAAGNPRSARATAVRCWPLDEQGLVGETIYAVDISASVELCGDFAGVQGIVSDVAWSSCRASVDAVVSSQVIEHLPDDRASPRDRPAAQAAA